MDAKSVAVTLFIAARVPTNGLEDKMNEVDNKLWKFHFPITEKKVFVEMRTAD